MDRRKALIVASVTAVTGASSLLAGCGGSDSPAPTPNIVQLAQATPSLNILVEAVIAAGLADTLSGAGPFTVFAPNDKAFVALLAELKISKDALLKDPVNKDLLRAVLTYHVLDAKVEKAGIPLGKAITPLQKSVFKIDAPGGALTITDGRNRTSTISATDVQASNGVVHIIDKVILPPNLNIVETAQSLPQQFSILVEAVIAAKLQGTLADTGPFTVFAPTNDAFAALLTELGVAKAVLLADTALLTKVLTYHVVPGRVLKADIVLNTNITTVQTETFQIDSALNIVDQRNRTPRPKITATDVFASNGVIHVIDKVILPKP